MHDSANKLYLGMELLGGGSLHDLIHEANKKGT
jgi:hypothetical protein